MPQKKVKRMNLNPEQTRVIYEEAARRASASGVPPMVPGTNVIFVGGRPVRLQATSEGKLGVSPVRGRLSEAEITAARVAAAKRKRKSMAGESAK